MFRNNTMGSGNFKEKRKIVYFQNESGNYLQRRYFITGFLERVTFWPVDGMNINGTTQGLNSTATGMEEGQDKHTLEMAGFATLQKTREDKIIGWGKL